MSKQFDHHSNLRILKEIAELLNEGTEISPLLSGVLQKLLKVTGVTTGWIFLIDKDGRHTVEAAEHLPPALLKNDCAPLEKGNCWCLDGFKKGTLTKASNIIECRRIETAVKRQQGETHGIAYHATIPLQLGDEMFGLLNVAAPGKKEFSRDELALLESVALQIGSAIKRIRLTKKEQEIALIEERNRLARDLHDSVNQILFSLSLTARGGIEMTEDPATKDTFRHIQNLSQQAQTEMRALIWQLRPNGLEKGLVQAIKSYGEMLGLEIDIKLSGVISLPARVEEAVWRVSQEALNNCKRHSGQDQVFISIIVAQCRVCLTIQDNGCGFIFEGEQSLPSLGIESMQDRVESLGGLFKLETAPGKGTTIIVELTY
ncbi:two-component system NarL family sensor kinase [Lederbergia galactosidilyticus]|uniref:GAF domain-containing sensor histidine kinase n=1 Tax=Lederbergia galactosidilytica TaxID=217031 RepID=UPI000B2B32CF|nr:GAF domain-containing sensor histidine kinase [Lederbergia galactosidilytica]MBP1917442.1 two-component system NarL family sensor kinase [Lederbergia galactosidilytica]